MIASGAAVGVMITLLIEISGFAGGGVKEVFGTLGLGAFIGGFFSVPADLSALVHYDLPPGMFLFMPNPFQVISILLLISAPFCALAAQGVARAYSRSVRAD